MSKIVVDAARAKCRKMLLQHLLEHAAYGIEGKLD
jgi:hypothetical protein